MNQDSGIAALRAEFEASMRALACPDHWTFDPDDVGGYHNHTTDWAWIAYQSAAADRVSRNANNSAQVIRTTEHDAALPERESFEAISTLVFQFEIAVGSAAHDQSGYMERKEAADMKAELLKAIRAAIVQHRAQETTPGDNARAHADRICGSEQHRAQEAQDGREPVSIDTLHRGAYFSWSQQNCGFGQLSFDIEPDGRITCGNEAMGREWVRHALHALADHIADNAHMDCPHSDESAAPLNKDATA